MEELQNKIIASFMMLFFVISGLYMIRYPKHAYRSTYLNLRNKNPSKSGEKLTVINGYISLIIGIAMIIIIFSGGIKGL